MNLSFDFERREYEALPVTNISDKYTGPLPLRHLYVSKSTLNVILSSTGNQCKLTSVGVM